MIEWIRCGVACGFWIPNWTPDSGWTPRGVQRKPPYETRKTRLNRGFLELMVDSGFRVASQKSGLSLAKSRALPSRIVNCQKGTKDIKGLRRNEPSLGTPASRYALALLEALAPRAPLATMPINYPSAPRFVQRQVVPACIWCETLFAELPSTHHHLRRTTHNPS